MRKVIAAVAALIGIVALTGCSHQMTAQDQETASGQSAYARDVKAQPAHSMDYSNARDTINFYADTWSKPGKLAYVYLLNNAGKPIGYFVTVGKPVSYCASLRPPYEFRSPAHWNDVFQVPAPGVDNVYYSGGSCDLYYGKDAITGAYIEYTAGQGINALIFDQPMAQFGDAKPLGDATVAKVKAKQGQ